MANTSRTSDDFYNAVDKEQVIAFIERVKSAGMKKEYAISDCWLYSSLHYWNRETKDVALIMLDELYEGNLT